jgi:hypothetical protein
MSAEVAVRHHEVQRLLQGLLTLSRAQLTLPPEQWPAVLARKEQLLAALAARDPQRLLAEGPPELIAETRRLGDAVQAAEAEACAAWAQTVQAMRAQTGDMTQRRTVCRSYARTTPVPSSRFLDGAR